MITITPIEESDEGYCARENLGEMGVELARLLSAGRPTTNFMKASASPVSVYEQGDLFGNLDSLLFMTLGHVREEIEELDRGQRTIEGTTREVMPKLEGPQ